MFRLALPRRNTVIVVHIVIVKWLSMKQLLMLRLQWLNLKVDGMKVLCLFLGCPGCNQETMEYVED